MINALELLRRQWETTSQPIKERATMLPLGQYEDGSVGLAWPGIIADPLQRGYEAANTPIPPINDDQGWADKSAAMFDAASLAPIAGLGMTAAGVGTPRGAIGSAGGKLGGAKGFLGESLDGLDELLKNYKTSPQIADETASGIIPENLDLPSAPIGGRSNMENTLAALDEMFGPREKIKKDPLFSNSKDAALPGLLANALEQPQGIRAYHGSPHDFDRFDISKIGTGEGAQAYGHGLYFADSEDVARSYRDMAASDGQIRVKYPDGREIIEAGDMASSLLHPENFNGDFAKAKAHAELIASQHRQLGNESAAIEAEQAAQKIANLQSHGAQISPGRMYEVNIKANPEDFLDWDKPLSQQPETVRSKLAEIVKVGDRAPKDWIEHSPGAEQRMREIGIPGIKYLDAMSRDGGAGTSNYVVFSDDIIDILRKYANAPTGSLPGLAAQTGQEDQNPALLDYLRSIGLY